MLSQPVFHSLKTMENNVRKIVCTHTSPPSLKQGKTVMDKSSKLDHLRDITPPSVLCFSPRIKKEQQW